MISDAVGVVDFPTLADLQDEWIEAHCLVPDGFSRGKPFRKYDWQFWSTAHHYRVRTDAEWIPSRPLLAQAFVNRRSLIVGPQKCGKGPDTATMVAVEAVGPSVFGGWARRGDVYDCEDFGCGCGFRYDYDVDEPKGIRHPSPLIQLTARSEDQVDNIYRPLKAMIRMGPLQHLMKVREGFVRIVGQNDDPELDRIDVVTASADSRLGNPISAAFQDEVGLWNGSNKMRGVADNQRRGAAGMGGRIVQTTNAWDPSEDSVAERTYAAAAAQSDVFAFFRQPPPALGSYLRKADRRKIHAHAYEGSEHVNLDGIEAEAAEMVADDPAQAERFFGNRIVAGGGTWLEDGLWESRRADRVAA